jgi:hypothetical protein
MFFLAVTVPQVGDVSLEGTTVDDITEGNSALIPMPP